MSSNVNGQCTVTHPHIGVMNNYRLIGEWTEVMANIKKDGHNVWVEMTLPRIPTLWGLKRSISRDRLTDEDWTRLGKDRRWMPVFWRLVAGLDPASFFPYAYPDLP